MKLWLTVVLALMCTPVAGGAQPSGEISGSISDQTGAAVPGARVTIRGAAVRTADSGAAGDFAFADIPEGDYETSVELSGFERQSRTVRLRAGERVTVSFIVRVALVAEAIVTAARTTAKIRARPRGGKMRLAISYIH